MTRAGRPLDPWQIDSLTLMLAVRDDGKWACFECCEWVSRQNGKGGILEARALTGFFLLGEELIMWSAHEVKTAMEALRRVKAIIRALGTQVKETDDNLWIVDGILVKFNNTNGDEAIERLDTGARIKFIARSKSSGRGFSGDVNIIDETFAYTYDQHAALLYTMAARPNPQTIYTSSPPLKGDSGAIMYDLRRRGDPTAPRGPEDGQWKQDPSLGYRDWGHAGDLDEVAVDVEDVAVAAAANPALGAVRSNGSGLTLETIQRELRSDRAGYPRERLGIWPRETRASRGWAVISEADWSAAHDPASELGDVLALAVSVAWDRSRASICAAGARPDGLLHGETVDNRAGTGWVVKRLVEVVLRNRPCAVVVNPGAPAGSLIPDIEAALREAAKKGLNPSVTEVTQVTSRGTAQAYGAFVDAVAGKPYMNDDGQLVDPRRFRHIGDTELTGSVMGGQPRKLGDGHAWDLKDLPEGVDGTPVDGVTLALQGYLTRPVVEVVHPPATARVPVGAGVGDMFRPSGRLDL